MATWTIYFDGLTEPVNPGGVMAWGFTVTCDGKVLAAQSGSIPAKRENTNNIAEYYALGYALKWVNESLAREGPGEFAGLTIYGDSKLVVSQVAGLWQVKAPHLQKLHARCLELLNATGQPWAIEWVPREQNMPADQLSRDAYRRLTGKEPPERKGAA